MLDPRAKPILLSPPHMSGAEQRFVEDAFRTNWVAPLGPNVDGFEREMSEYLGFGTNGARLHCCATSSGTAAIHLGLMLLGVRPGDCVLCSSFTFVASANPIRQLGAEPVFVDSDEASWNLSPSALRDAIATLDAEGRRPRALIAVDLYGQGCDYGSIEAICDEWDIPILEDAAESLGATVHGRRCGTFGKVAAFSFNGNKIITTSGGGMLVSSDAALVERARFLATQAREPRRTTSTRSPASTTGCRISARASDAGSCSRSPTAWRADARTSPATRRRSRRAQACASCPNPCGAARPAGFRR